MILRGSVFSQTLDTDTGITVIAPDRGDGTLPPKVVYLLHGLSGSSGNWSDLSTLPDYASDYRAVFVMPEAGRSFYADMAYGGRYFSYVAEELPEICARTFNISSRREDTVIAGCSMGGFGALKCALSKPARYGACCALSSGCLFLRRDLASHRGNFEAVYGERLLRDFRAILGEDLEWRADMEILALAEKAAECGKTPKIYASCGAGDPLREDNALICKELSSLGFDVTYEEPPGGHNWRFFDAALRRALTEII